jgi:penicillin-binding protein-related factor A (putative recombinase)
MSNNNPGRYLEKQIEKELKKITDSTFRWRRLPDAHAARGALAAQPADFFIASDGMTIHLEAKSVGGKTFRLPRFSQESELRAWSRAGVLGYILVHFYEMNVFKAVDIRDLEPGKPSWVLKDFPSLEGVGEALEFILS